MECHGCHAPNPETNRFCENCGSALARQCSSCGFAIAPAARFCGGCGTPLGRAAAAAPATRPVALAGVTPAHGWGELKQATVLFADVVSSTEQIALLDPEQAMERLQPAVMAMCEVVERFGGTVIRTLGDGVMALFGVPRALEGHARLACESALQMQAAFNEPHGLRIRVGLHSGLVASDPHAQDGGKGGGAHGLTIHLASRVIGVAPPGGVTITLDCYSLVRGLVDAESIGLVALKGISEQVEIFALEGLKPAFASQHFNQAKLTPFRGRDKELALLQQAQRLTEAGNAQVFGVSGGPGSGKSRLCFEFAQWCRARGRPVFEVRAQLYGSATPLQPVLELMRVFFFGINANDAPGVARTRIEARLREMGSAQPGDYALLCDFLGVAEAAEDAAPPLPAKARRARLLSSVTALVKHSANTVAVILIEDMHWLDDASEEFVAALVEAVASTKTMVVLNYRSSYRSPWAGLENFGEVEIGELSAADTDALVRELISHRREFQDISQLIAKRSGGNPFFAEELVRSVAERGMLSGDPSHGSNGIESVERALPATVQAVIGARIDRLSESEKSLLQMCAIIGKEVPMAVLDKVAGATRAQIERAMDSLCQSELIQPQPAAGGRRFTFRHPLIQEVAYGTQMKAKRATIHAAVASAMVTYYADQLDEFSALVAHHYEAAGQVLEAASYSSRAAQWLGSTNPAQAIEQWHKVRNLLSGYAADERADRLKAMACSQISLLGWREGLNLEQVQPFIDEAMQLAVKVDKRLTQLLLTIEGRMLQASGGPADWYVQRVEEALGMVDRDADKGRLATLHSALSQAYGWAGLLNHALAANDAALAGLSHIDRADHEFMGFSVGQWAMGMRGRLLMRCDRAAEADDAWRGMLEVQGNPDPTVHIIRHLAHVEFAWCKDDAALAQEHADSIALLAERHPVPYLRPVALSCRAMALTVAGDYAGASKAFEEALWVVRTSNVATEYETDILSGHAECKRREKKLEVARALAEEALDVSRQRTMRLSECRALITLGATMLQEPDADLDGAAQMFEAAHELIELTGAAIYRGHLDAAREQWRQIAHSLAAAHVKA
ncbi:AAA family ATPase [Caenimonas koreensis]|uniref:AAA family ATPase n=1 Tax=Caenimonas koreensis TaxID=367474 RepID=UPI0037843001